MSATAAVFAWVGLVLGLVVAGVVLALLSRVLRPILEIKRYAATTLEAGLGIARHLDGLDEAARTRELATAVPPLAVAYLEEARPR